MTSDPIEFCDKTQAVCDKATPGPWCDDDHIVNDGDSPGSWHVFESGEDDPPLMTASFLEPEANCHFAALAREALPEALSMIRALVAEKEAVEAQCAAMREAMQSLWDAAMLMMEPNPKDNYVAVSEPTLKHVGEVLRSSTAGQAINAELSALRERVKVLEEAGGSALSYLGHAECGCDCEWCKSAIKLAAALESRP